MIARIALETICALGLATLGASAAPPEVKIPATVHLLVLEPLISPCADPTADHFLEIDISRPPAGAARAQRVSGWVTEDGTFH